MFLLATILFFEISTLLFIGKGDFLIAGLNAMSEEEKEKIDTIRLNRFMGKMMYVISGGCYCFFSIVSTTLPLYWRWLCCFSSYGLFLLRFLCLTLTLFENKQECQPHH
ncbi:DUF3784 domain-containing protein [Shouchella clausii]|uniref:DUF3784 domain-containing protein n=1 Tax=Shouchella clausii TaxID=79880 RepID=UPI001C72EE65|nr:DUF3784 domain-containing protein [Shouchella clausii]